MKINEVLTVPTISKKKSLHTDVLPNDGKPIPRGEERDYLGKRVGKIGSREVWKFRTGGADNYAVYDPETRTSQLACSGTQYKNNPSSLIIGGVYSGPKNTTRASELYYFLIRDLGLTLISDYKQSEGGQRVWRDLERRFGRQLNIHAFNTKTNEPINVSTREPEDTHVPHTELATAPQGMKHEISNKAKNIRYVASLK